MLDITSLAVPEPLRAPPSGIFILDCDEVLVQWQAGFRNWLARTGRVARDPGAPPAGPFSTWLNVAHDVAQEWVAHFNDTPGTGFENLLPVDGAVEAVRALREAGYRLHVLTACSADPHTIARREEHLASLFGDIFEEVRGVPLLGSKLAELQRHEPSIFIDDFAKNADCGKAAGHQSIIMQASHSMVGFETYAAGHHRMTGWDDLMFRHPEFFRLQAPAPSPLGLAS